MKYFVLPLMVLLLLFGCKEKVGRSSIPPAELQNDSLVVFTRMEGAAIISELLSLDNIKQEINDDTLRKISGRWFITEHDSIVSEVTFKILRDSLNMFLRRERLSANTYLGQIIFHEEKFQKKVPPLANGWGDQEITVQLFYDKSTGLYGMLSKQVAACAPGRKPFKPREAMNIFLENYH